MLKRSDTAKKGALGRRSLRYLTPRVQVSRGDPDRLFVRELTNEPFTLVCSSSLALTSNASEVVIRALSAWLELTVIFALLMSKKLGFAQFNRY